MSEYPVCPDCGAVGHGNLTCRTCRANMRDFAASRGWKTDLYDRLDAMNIELVAPVGVDEMRSFMGRLSDKEAV